MHYFVEWMLMKMFVHDAVVVVVAAAMLLLPVKPRGTLSNEMDDHTNSTTEMTKNDN